jgi:hypothetical protein
MINNPKKRIFLIFFLFLIHFGLKAQTTSVVYTFNQNGNPPSLVKSNTGDFYFSENQVLKKLSSDGTVSFIAYMDGYDGMYGFGNKLAIDSLDNIYYYNYYNRSIIKISPDGDTSILISEINYLESLKFDSVGNNLYFTDYDPSIGEHSIKKYMPDGQIIVVTSGGYYGSFTIDRYGNLFYSDGNSIRKVTQDSIISVHSYVSIYISDMACDFAGNIYYTSPYNSTIQKVSPDGTDQVYLANNIYLENPFGLVSDPSGVLYYVNYNNSPRLIKVSLPCDQPSSPIVTDQSFEDAASVANLVAMGDNIKWYSVSTGGNALLNSTALSSRTYYVTQTVNDCESNRIPVIVTINKMGLNRNGQISSVKSTQLTKNGEINATSYVNKQGKSIQQISTGNYELNYEIFTAPGSHPSNSNEFSSYVNPANLVSSGTNSASLLLNWENSGALTNANITIPNSGDQFAVQVSGFFIPQESGIYTFTCEGDDAVDLFIDGVNVANHYGGHGIEGLGSHTGTIELNSGEIYTFRARMQENGGGEGLKVFWRKPSESNSNDWYIDINELSSTN